MFDVASIPSIPSIFSRSPCLRDPEGSARVSTDPGDLKGAFKARNFPEVDDNKALSQ